MNDELAGVKSPRKLRVFISVFDHQELLHGRFSDEKCASGASDWARKSWTGALAAQHSLEDLEALRLLRAHGGDLALDGLDPNAYPIDSLRQLAADAQSGGVAEGAKAELYFSSFFIAYAADLKIGRVAPQKVDPNLFRNRKTIDALRVLSDMQKQPDAGKALSLFEPRSNHYQTLKRMLRAYTRVINEGLEWPVIGQGDSYQSALDDVRSAQQRVALHVDEVLGSHEVVVKNLGPQLSRLPGLAGMTLLASGAVALIYNPVALATLYGDVAREQARRGGAVDEPVAPVAPTVTGNTCMQGVFTPPTVVSGETDGITYAVTQDNDGILLKRVGDIEVFPTGFDPAWDKQLTAQQSGFRSTLAKNMNARANAGECDLVAKGRLRNDDVGFLYVGNGRFISNRAGQLTSSSATLRDLPASCGQDLALTFTCVPPGAGVRVAIDRDGDGFRDGDEQDAGTDPANPASHR